MNLVRRMAAAAALFGCLFAGGALAQYPERPINLIVPYPAGGVTDLAGRAFAEGLSRRLGRPVVVLNKTGAGATIGGNFVATANPDGYTLGFFPIAAVAPEAFKFLYHTSYSSTDLKAIASVAVTAMSFAVKADSPIRTMRDVVRVARDEGGIQVGTPGKQGLPSMILTMMARQENVKIQDVPFGGDSKTLPALLGGVIPVAAIDYSVLRSSVQAGKIRVLAVCSDQRVDFAPDVPTMQELGYQQPYVSSLGIFAPKGLPAHLVEKLQEAARAVTQDRAFAERMQQMSIQPAFKDAATYQKIVFRDRDNLIRFFEQQGLLK